MPSLGWERRLRISSSESPWTSTNFARDRPLDWYRTDGGGTSNRSAMRRSIAAFALPSQAGSRQWIAQRPLQGSHTIRSTRLPGRAQISIRPICPAGGPPCPRKRYHPVPGQIPFATRGRRVPVAPVGRASVIADHDAGPPHDDPGPREGHGSTSGGSRPVGPLSVPCPAAGSRSSERGPTDPRESARYPRPSTGSARDSPELARPRTTHRSSAYAALAPRAASLR